MPQFDQGSFLNQVFWFFFFFLNSYFLITYFFLPLICKNLKFRKKKLQVNQDCFQEIQLENLQQQLFLNTTFYKIGNHFSTLLKNTNENAIDETEPLKKILFSNLKFKINFINFHMNLIAYPKYFN